MKQFRPFVEIFYSENFWISIKNFGLLSKNFRHVCWNCSLSVHRKLLRKNFISLFLLSFFDTEQKILGLSLEDSPRVCQNCIFSVRNYILKENVFFRQISNFFFFSQFWILSEKCLPCGKNFLTVLKEFHSTYQLEFFKEKN